MSTHQVFISHSSTTKELARQIYYNAISNGISVWYDEALLNIGDELELKIREGIENSGSFLLLHSKAAMEKRWVPMEMEIAKQKHTLDKSFKIIVVKLDDEPLPGDSFWNRFLYSEWSSNDHAGNILKILERITERKGLVSITASAVLTSEPSTLFVNESATIAEHTRNYAIWYLCHIKHTLNAVTTVGFDSEIRDTIRKLLQLFLFENIPMIHGGFIPVGPGVFELIHPTRMRIPPRVAITGMPSRYEWELTHNNEVFTRIRIIDTNSKETVQHLVPLSISIEFSAEIL
ncbi:MAG: toll/interleukin-1 receptor domain-containing protein [Anaerolineales bacterium]|nr:MAG: toll/interleukin-1 receptor domain-containing protein [Anaerolineales bacterium]